MSPAENKTSGHTAATPAQPDNNPAPVSVPLLTKDLETQADTGTSCTPWRCICHLELSFANGDIIRGIAWFIDEKTLVTAGHNLLDPKRGWARTIAIRPGYCPEGMSISQLTYATGSDVHPAWKEGIRRGHLSYNKDIAYIKVADPALGRFLGHLSFRAITDSELLHANLIVGYPVATTPGAMCIDASRTDWFDANFLYYRLKTPPENSGAPVFANFPDGSRHVVGCDLHGAAKYTSNSGVRLSQDIVDFINAAKEYQ